MFLDCPHSWENMQKNDVYYAREQAVTFTGYDQTEMQRLGHESRNCAVLDTACTSTVCGDRWLQCYRHPKETGWQQLKTRIRGCVYVL